MARWDIEEQLGISTHFLPAAHGETLVGLWRGTLHMAQRWYVGTTRHLGPRASPRRARERRDDAARGRP